MSKNYGLTGAKPKKTLENKSVIKNSVIGKPKKAMGRPRREDEFKAFTVNIPTELITELKLKCIQEGLTQSDLTKNALVEYLKKQ